LNTPIQAKDSDGNLVIYLNGEVEEFKGGKSKNKLRASIDY